MKIKDLIKKYFKKETPNYPREYYIVDFTGQAKKEGIRDDQNKVILMFYINNLGFRAVKRLRYSEPTIYSLRETKKIPSVDLTKKEDAIPTFYKVDLSTQKYER